MTKNHSKFHDGFLDGLWIDNKTIHVYVRTFEREPFTAVASQVAALTAGGFRAGNIILELLLRGYEEISAEDIRELYDLRDDAAGKEQCARLLAKAREDAMTILEINPSYGASCLVIAKSVDLLTRSEWLQRYAVKPSINK